MTDTEELLKFALEKGIIDLTTIAEAKELSERKEILKNHKYAIWQGKDNKWYTYFYNEDGKRRLIKKSSEKDLQDTIVSLYKENTEVFTFGKVFYQWVAQKIEFGEITKATVDRYEADYKRYVKGTTFDTKDIGKFTENELEDFIKKTIRDFNMSAKMWSGLRTIFIGTFRFAKKHDLSDISIKVLLQDIEISPKSFKKTYKLDSEQVFTDEEIEKLVDEIEVSKPSIVNLGILLALNTGLRAGELSTLRWSDVSENFISVSKTQIRYKDDEGNYKIDIANHAKTEAGRRQVVLTEQCKTILKELRKTTGGCEYVFQNGNTYTRANSFTAKLYVLCERCKIQKKSLHKCRKTYATKLLNANVSPKIVIKQLGHTNLQTTNEYYYFVNKNVDKISFELEKALSLEN